MAKKEAKASKNENVKNKKSFSKDFKAELKKVVWPTPKQLVNNTAVVITIVLITAVIVFVLDIIFESTSKFVVNQADKAIVASQEENSTDNENTGDENANTGDENANTEIPDNGDENVEQNDENSAQENANPETEAEVDSTNAENNGTSSENAETENNTINETE